MTEREKLTRNMIVRALVDALEPLNYAYAFWEGGAAAFGRIDEWSDVDLYLVVDDKKVDEAFLVVEKTLKSLSPIEQKYRVTHSPQSGLFQAFYRLKEASEYLLIDLAVLTLSSPEKFLEPEIHGDAVFFFNRSDEVKPPSLDKEALMKKLSERLERLHANFDMFNNFIQKEINRSNHLEAINLYHTLTLAALTEALRVRYSPLHHDFKMRYIHYELPSHIIKKLKCLYFVRDGRDLQEKYDRASRWFREIVSEINREEVKKLRPEGSPRTGCS